ncbi:uncharacterized protein LOC132977924 [Labrus mixtus]|uniref:uncharacterized protein LOC132977924 n=1 Tax=Labrus mixtus TaxID=508554 RepID=UPI0029C01F9D|nr:uncharacterized protein LOC132977924 [Labrus mixtus]
MDDLDHSMHIADYDWTSFFDDSEECGLLQPSLACPDHSSFSDSEDSGKSSPVFITGQHELQQSRDANSDETQSNAEPCSVEEVQNNLSWLGGEKGEPNTKAKEDTDTQENCKTGLDHAEENTTNTEEVNVRAAEHVRLETKDVTDTLQTKQIDVQSSDAEEAEPVEDNGDLQTESDTCELKPIQEPDPLSYNRTELNVNEHHSTNRAESVDVSGVALRAERERWFVTVNDSPARQRVCAPSGKKKRRQKKSRRHSHMCRTSKQETSFENGFKLEINTDNIESDISEVCQNAEDNPQSHLVGVTSDLSQMSSTSGEEDNLLEKLSMCHYPKDIFTLHDTFTTKGPSRFDIMESDDGAEFLSTHSYDSESYLSAAESIDEPQHCLTENQPLACAVSLAKTTCLNDLPENTDADDTQVIELLSRDNTLFCNATAPVSEGHESTGVEPCQTFPSVGQRVNKMPDDDSTCVNDAHSVVPCMSSDSPGLQKHEINLPASVCSSGDQLSSLTVPDLTVQPCLVVDSPETYAEAVGNTRPVYAISAFWDEMEKLTINDILQLRMGGSPPPRKTHETVTPDVGDFPKNPSSSDETMEYSLSNFGSMDASDTADSDYSTQADESKPDRSSCEFSTSDFEEEYWQFLGASRNPSPDPQSKNQQGTSESPFFEEEESSCSEGKETPVPSEDFAGYLFEDQDSTAFYSRELVGPRQITKSRSVRNVPALNTENVSMQFLLGNDDSSLFLCSCPSLEASGSLRTLKPTPFLTSTRVLDKPCQFSTPEVFENLLKDQSRRDSCVTFYDSENISLAPVFDDTFRTFSDEMSLSSLHDFKCSDEKPIPIFSCSHPTVRELTFPIPDHVFLSSDISPFRVLSRSFIQGSMLGISAATLRDFSSLLWTRKIFFQNNCSIWCGSSGAWVFPVEAGNNTTKGEDPPLTVFTEGSVSTNPSKLIGELAVQQTILETIQTKRQEGISALKQSDMCLVCIAFASWVLRSSDPEAADTWKAALLANVSALSAIQYLRHYVKRNPSQDHP